jgi:hypothetical protein
MNTQELVRELAATQFATRYYRLCDQFPQRHGNPGRCTKRNVLAILAALARTPSAEERGKAFEFAAPAGGWETSCGFILQRRELVEFWCCFERRGVRVGENFTGLARRAAEVSRLSVPDPPYPRPIYRSVADLCEILAELFALQDLITARVAGPEKWQGPHSWPEDEPI